MPGPLKFVLDSCVLYPAPLRDLLMQLALCCLLRPHWSERFHEERMSNLLKNHPDLTPAQLERKRDLMNAYIAECTVSGCEQILPRIKLPDDNDRHALAVAIFSGADAIVTFNLRDFPRGTLQGFGIEANQLHWSLDVNFTEDSSRIRVGSGATTFGHLRRIALSGHQTRHFAGQNLATCKKTQNPMVSSSPRIDHLR